MQFNRVLMEVDSQHNSSVTQPSHNCQTFCHSLVNVTRFTIYPFNKNIIEALLRRLPL